MLKLKINWQNIWILPKFCVSLCYDDETVVKNDAPVAVETSEEETTKTENIDVDGLIRELRLNGEISDEDKIILNEDETGIDVDVYKNGRWFTNIVLYEYV